MSSDCLDQVVRSLHLRRRQLVGCMGDDALEMVLQKVCEPSEVGVPGLPADVDDAYYLVSHPAFVIQGIGIGELLLDDVCSEEQLVLTDQTLILVQLLRLPLFQSVPG